MSIRNLLHRGAWLSVILVSAVLASWSLQAADDDKPEPKPRAKTVHRLPPYFGDVVSEQQRETIYGLQDEYAPQLEKLKQQMRVLVAERDAKIYEVLDAEQQAKIVELRAAAKAARAKKIAEESEDEENAEETVAPAAKPAAAPAAIKPVTPGAPAKPAAPSAKPAATPAKPK
ncbi:MAG: hypothetical protein AB7O62_21225 [Pirellulales bacterium]